MFVCLFFKTKECLSLSGQFLCFNPSTQAIHIIFVASFNFFSNSIWRFFMFTPKSLLFLSLVSSSLVFHRHKELLTIYWKSSSPLKTYLFSPRYFQTSNKNQVFSRWGRETAMWTSEVSENLLEEPGLEWVGFR